MAGMASSYSNLASFYEVCNDFDRAEDMQLKAIKLFRQLGYLREIADNYLFLGRIYVSRKHILKIYKCVGLFMVFSIRSVLEDRMKRRSV